MKFSREFIVAGFCCVCVKNEKSHTEENQKKNDLRQETVQ